MKTLLLFFAGLSACFAANPVGDWHGTLKTGGPELRLALHIQQTAEGAFRATLDSIDQGANGIPVSDVKLQGNHLTLDVQAVKGGYEGEISEDGKTITGTWSQGGRTMPLTFSHGAAPKTEVAEDYSSVAPLLGIWEGTLDAGALKLRLRFTFRKNEKGQIQGSFDSIDQGANGIPMTGMKLSDSKFHFDLRAVGGTYDGTVSSDGKSIQGTWRQGGTEAPLEWKKVDKASALNRPQEPKPPYPYRAQDVTYTNSKAAGVELAGTLTIPQGKGPFPAVVLISGSGPQDRDESIMGHKPFLVLADHLTRHGIAALRFDDRGAGKSKGDFNNATSADFATDVEAGVEYLKTRREIDGAKIGLIGHSEGGMIAPMVSAGTKDVVFLVLIAGPGEPGTRILLKQARVLMKTSGKSEVEIEKALASEKQIFDILLAEKDDEAAREKLLAVLKASGQNKGNEEAAARMMVSPWFRYFVAYDPVPALEKIKIPVLAISGEKDLQVEPKSNLAGIRTALAKAVNQRAELVEMSGLNHLLQKSSTGAVSEYGTIEETINPAALTLISDWIAKTVKLPQISSGVSNR